MIDIPTVLIIEDDETKLMIILSLLKRAGILMMRAESLEKAQERLNERDFDLLILDGEVSGSVDVTIAFLKQHLARKPEQLVLANSSKHNQALLAAGCVEELEFPNPASQVRRLLKLP